MFYNLKKELSPKKTGLEYIYAKLDYILIDKYFFWFRNI